MKCDLGYVKYKGSVRKVHSLEKQIKGFRPGGDFCADSDCKTVALLNIPKKDDLSLKARKNVSLQS